MIKRVAIVDSRLMLYNLHHKHQPLSGFHKYVMSFLKDLPCSKIFYAMDIGKSRKRTTIFPEYKGHRKERDKKASAVDKARLKAMNKFYYSMPKYLETIGTPIGIEGVEADDIANVICDKFIDTDWEVILVTSDSDWGFNLKSPNIKIMHVSREKLINQYNMVEEFKVKDYKELISYQIHVGSPKENVLGINQLGIKRFVKALELGLEDTLKHWLEIGKYGMKLPEGFDTLEELLERNSKILSPFTVDDFNEDELSSFKEQFNKKRVVLDEDSQMLLEMELFGTIIT